MTIVYTNDMIVKENYTVEEVSKKLRVSQRTILREISRGKLKFKKVGRKYLISNYELKSYLNKSEDLEKAIDRYLRENRVEMINLLQKMVSIPSVGYKKDQELQLAKFIKERMQELGIRSTIMREGDAIAVRGSYGYSEEGILINCPLDTAPIGDINQWKYPPFGGVIKAGKIYGRGTADCKAGIVSAIYTLLALKKAIDEENIRLELVFDGAEQDGTYLGMKMVI